MSNRNTLPPITPHNILEKRVEGLRDYQPPPTTYKKYLQQPNGRMIFVGEFPTPEVNYKMIKGGK